MSTATTRLYECAIDVEDPNGYHTGRYFPVTLGNEFKGGRYRVLHKLGWSGFATVWLARDNLSSEFYTTSNNPALPRQMLATQVVASVLQLLDHFELATPYMGLIFPVMGMDLRSRIDAQHGQRLPKQVALNVCSRVALGLDYLWKCGIAHGDLYSKNVLYSAPAVSQLSEDEIMPYLGKPVTGRVQMTDGQSSSPSMPPYLVRPVSIRGDDMDIRIADLGNAFFHENPPSRLYTPWHMRTPESVYAQPLDKNVDMWSVGCLIFEIITGRTFMDSFLADRMDMIVGLKQVLGQPPSKLHDSLESDVRNMLDSTPARDMGFYQYLELNYNQDDAKLLALDGYEDEEEIPIEESEKLPPEFTETDLMSLTEILLGLLSYEPQERGTLASLLRTLSRLDK
ncbi:CMGC/SRPK protein kinase [Blastomyces dermatitidis ATCC 18188]|uniref:non-specific serine/threonine protein kinase n=1 Tax=Ajellomyces dermatitidis (strain ATCC 18188 / CBS 674.68) TaxID=653446 RepID=F2TAY7_AJEDA|nr:CMGC/SRPK protein kinase [Blastomyces dermatitidis ATCC 18188]